MMDPGAADTIFVTEGGEKNRTVIFRYSFKFTFHKDLVCGVKRWFCSGQKKYQCKAFIKTVGQEVVDSCDIHTHTATLEEKGVTLIKRGIKRKSIDDISTRQSKVDVSALNKQVNEKINRLRFEQLENEKHALLTLRVAEKAIQEEQRAEQEKRRICKDIDDYRMIHQKKQLSRDYDLEKPSTHKESTIGRDDERSGVTIFEGEDDNLKERIKAQKTQLKTWLLQQMKEREMNEEAMKSTDRLYEETSIERDKRSQELEQMEQSIQIRMERATSEYNMALAKQKEHETNRQRQENARWNEMEILNSITSDLLQENPDLVKSSLGPGRINTTMYKGMTQEMIEEIRAIQQRQVEENKAKRIRDEYEMKSWNNYDNYVMGITTEAEQEKERKLKCQKKELECYNEMLGKRQRDMEKLRNEVIYANKITGEYFSQFNTGSR